MRLSNRPGTSERPPSHIAALLVLLSSGALSSCGILLPDNVKGSFVCSAPSGTCAPSTVIDDQAIAMIAAAPPQQPALQRPQAQRYSRTRVQSLVPALGDAGHTNRDFARISDSLAHRGPRTLRVVFPAFVDEAGNLHEARVVHAVVDQGGWAQLSEGSLAPAPADGDAAAESITAELTPVLPTPAAPPSADIHPVQETPGRLVPMPAQPQPDAALTIEAIRVQVAERLSGARTSAQTTAPTTEDGAKPLVGPKPLPAANRSVTEEGAAPTNPSAATNAPATLAGPAGE